MKTMKMFFWGKLCFGLFACVALVVGKEELHTFRFRLDNVTLHGVAEIESDENWMSHHIFPSSLGPGITIGRDDKAGIEVFRYDKEAACYARPITKDTRTVWEIRSMLQILDEHDQVLEQNRKAKREYLECTGKQLSPERLGNVQYLCRGLPVYTLRQVAQTKLANLPRVKGENVFQKQRAGGCGICWNCNRGKKAALNDSCLAPRVVYIKPCIKSEE